MKIGLYVLNNNKQITRLTNLINTAIRVGSVTFRQRYRIIRIAIHVKYVTRTLKFGVYDFRLTLEKLL